jgi:hypothetical protein
MTNSDFSAYFVQFLKSLFCNLIPSLVWWVTATSPIRNRLLSRCSPLHGYAMKVPNVHNWQRSDWLNRNKPTGLWWACRPSSWTVSEYFCAIRRPFQWNWWHHLLWTTRRITCNELAEPFQIQENCNVRLGSLMDIIQGHLVKALSTN